MLTRVIEDDQADKIPLNHVSFWVQIHNLPTGFRSSKIVQDIGTYIGTFLEMDSDNFNGIWRTYLPVRVNIDIRTPLKRRMRIKKPTSEWVWVEFRYE